MYLTGGRFTTGGVRLRSHVTLHIGQNTTLKGTRVPTDYDILRGDRLEPLPGRDFGNDGTDRPHERFPGCRWCNGLVHLVDATDAHIIGDSGALIDGADSQTNGRKNTLSLFTYYADPSVPVRHTPGDILVENCLVENTDRFLHYNFSGNEIWQSVHPLSGITFRSVIARGLSLLICAYGSPDEPLTLHIENCLLSFRETPPDVLRAAHYREISLKNVIFGNTGDAPIASWGSDGEIIREDVLHLAGPVRHAEEAFYAQPI